MRGNGVAVIVRVKFRAHDADVGVTVALAPSTNHNMGDPVVVRPQHLGNLVLPNLFKVGKRCSNHLLISEDLVTKGVQAHERDADVSGGNPVLQFVVVIKVVRARPPVQGGEGHVATGERGDV